MGLHHLCAAGCFAVAWAAGAFAADLTPSGAERAGSADAAIPAWGGSEAAPAGWSRGKPRLDFARTKAEKPLFSIDAGNVDKYADKLSPGQLQTFKRFPQHRMDVYPSHRNCGNPDFVDANSQKNLTTAKLNADGTALAQANLPGVPFPQPKNGNEAIWNFLMRYQGVGIVWPQVFSFLTARAGSNEPLLVYGPQSYYFPWGAKGTTTPEGTNQLYFAFSYAYEQPVALAGQALVQRFYYDKPSETFYYFPGQRRVRRMPTYAYDAPILGYENQYMVDESFLFYGNPDRFDWKLVGKKEMYVPNNNFGMYDASVKVDKLVQNGTLNTALRRYELHRVWVVEAMVKSGMRHLAPKRTFYLDEDSWIAVVAEQYDGQGKLWKAKESYPIPVWELGACASTTFMQLDFTSGRLLLDLSPLTTGKEMYWSVDGKEPMLNSTFYSSEQLQSRSER